MPDTPLAGNWSYPTRIHFGAGRIAELPKAARELGMTRPLLVTDPGLSALPVVTRAVGLCREAGLEVALFDRVKGNPSEANVTEGVAVLREGGHDGVIAFGGGSALDAGKAIAFMAGQDRPVADFDDKTDGWKLARTEGILPVVAVPTTAGTGSEVGRASVITVESQGRKVIVFHPLMLPGIVISDPELTLGLPPHLTAATGMDALAHCLEAYLAPGFHPMADGIALEGLRLIHEALPTAVAHGQNLEARAKMLAAAAMGAVAFQKGLGAIHSLSHPIGALYDTHHGLTNAVVAPYVVAYNRPAVEARLATIADVLNLPGTVERWIVALNERFGHPKTLAGLGLDDSKADRIAELAAEDPTAPTNPRPMGPAEMRKVFLAALEGRTPAG